MMNANEARGACRLCHVTILNSLPSFSLISTCDSGSRKLRELKNMYCHGCTQVASPDFLSFKNVESPCLQQIFGSEIASNPFRPCRRGKRKPSQRTLSHAKRKPVFQEGKSCDITTVVFPQLSLERLVLRFALFLCPACRGDPVLVLGGSLFLFHEHSVQRWMCWERHSGETSDTAHTQRSASEQNRPSEQVC